MVSSINLAGGHKSARTPPSVLLLDASGYIQEGLGKVDRPRSVSGAPWCPSSLHTVPDTLPITLRAHPFSPPPHTPPRLFVTAKHHGIMEENDSAVVQWFQTGDSLERGRWDTREENGGMEGGGGVAVGGVGGGGGVALVEGVAWGDRDVSWASIRFGDYGLSRGLGDENGRSKRPIGPSFPKAVNPLYKLPSSNHLSIYLMFNSTAKNYPQV